MSEFGIALGVAPSVYDSGSRHHPVPCGRINSTTHPVQSLVSARQVNVVVSRTLDKAESLYRQKINRTVAVRYIRLAAK